MNWTEQEYQEYLSKHGTQQKQPEKKNKYHNNRLWNDGILWDSEKELNYYKSLKLLQRANIITGFCRQCQFILSEGTDKDNRAITYLADFIIFYPDKTYKIVDVKGLETEIFKQKAKLFKNKFPELKLELK